MVVLTKCERVVLQTIQQDLYKIGDCFYHIQQKQRSIYPEVEESCRLFMNLQSSQSLSQRVGNIIKNLPPLFVCIPESGIELNPSDPFFIIAIAMANENTWSYYNFGDQIFRSSVLFDMAIDRMFSTFWDATSNKYIEEQKKSGNEMKVAHGADAYITGCYKGIIKEVRKTLRILEQKDAEKIFADRSQLDLPEQLKLNVNEVKQFKFDGGKKISANLYKPIWKKVFGSLTSELFPYVDYIHEAYVQFFHSCMDADAEKYGYKHLCCVIDNRLLEQNKKKRGSTGGWMQTAILKKKEEQEAVKNKSARFLTATELISRTLEDPMGMYAKFILPFLYICSFQDKLCLWSNEDRELVYMNIDRAVKVKLQLLLDAVNPEKESYVYIRTLAESNHYSNSDDLYELIAKGKELYEKTHPNDKEIHEDACISIASDPFAEKVGSVDLNDAEGAYDNLKENTNLPWMGTLPQNKWTEQEKDIFCEVFASHCTPSDPDRIKYLFWGTAKEGKGGWNFSRIVWDSDKNGNSKNKGLFVSFLSVLYEGKNIPNTRFIQDVFGVDTDRKRDKIEEVKRQLKNAGFPID